MITLENIYGLFISKATISDSLSRSNFCACCIWNKKKVSFSVLEKQEEIQESWN